MARPIHKLTPAIVERKSRIPGSYGDGGGLYLYVSPPSACSWVYCYTLEGKSREMGLGPYPDISLSEARELADEWRRVKARGQDPWEVRESQRASNRATAARAITFETCAETYIAEHTAEWKSDKHGKQWGGTLKAYAYPHIGDTPVALVDDAAVQKVLKPIWTTKTETASRVRGRIEAILDWAKVKKYRDGENPARWRGHLEHVFPERTSVRPVKHFAAIDYEAVPAFFVELQKQDGVAADALEFTILTAARTTQTLKAHWSEIDMEKALWTIPGARMKGKKGKERLHRVPLSKQAIPVLKKRHETTGGQGFVFPNPRKPKKPLSNMAMLELLRRMGRDDITVHGFRSAFKDWAAEKTTFPNMVSEMALAHVIESETEEAYRRRDLLEKREKLMAAWATYCTTPNSGAKVITMGKRG